MIKNKNASAIAIFFTLTIALTLFALPTTTAQSTRKSYAFIGASPNPIGVGQELLLHVGVTQQLQNAAMGWEGLTVTVTKPDGTTQTLGPFRTDSTGGTGAIYVPSVAGNYTFQTHFPEQITTDSKRAGGTPVGTLMLASDSEIVTVVVMDEQRIFWQPVPLPTEYWTRPIDAQFREWSSISGSWLSTPDNLFAPYNDDAPETAHILWTKPFTTGGLAGGAMGEQGMDCGDAYEGKFPSRFILNGRLYYTAGPYEYPRLTYCVDLRTGEQLWAKVFLDNRTISFAQQIYWDSYNYHAVFEYLWVTVGSTWYGFDAFTGEWMNTMYNVPSGTNIVGEKGEIYRYSISLSQGSMTLWNQSAFVSMAGSWGSAHDRREYNVSSGYYRNIASNGTFGSWSTSGASDRVERAWALNFTFPTGLPGSVRKVSLGDRVFGASVTSNEVVTWAFSLKPGQEGQLLFNKTWKAPSEWAAGNLTVSSGASSIDEGLYTVNVKELRQHYGFSTETGEYLWITEPEHYLDIYNYGRYSYIAYGKLFAVGMSGIINAYDVKTGELLWKYNAYDPLSEILWSDNWPMRPLFITDGKIYLGHEEHSPVDPKPRGAPLIALDVETGEEVFRVDGLFRQTFWGGIAIIGDSVIATQDTYDQSVYAIGKGPSAMTVTAPDAAIELGKSLVIKGTVTDVSPGTKDYAVTSRFPYGVPAVSDASMSEWMKYVYKQFPRPTNVTGVEVTINVVDANGNFREIGKTTTSTDGVYSLQWTPDIEGKYNVYATFAGSAAFYPSHAENSFAVDPAPEPSPPSNQVVENTSVADQFFLPAVSGLAVVMIVIGALLAMLLLRKK